LLAVEVDDREAWLEDHDDGGGETRTTAAADVIDRSG
jgi:hypothetical protein